MKTKVLGFISLGPDDSPWDAFSAKKIEKIKVSRICNDCEKHIVNTVSLLKGIVQTKWDGKSEILSVEFDPKSINLETIELAIADAGHDTTHHKGKIQYYAQMPPCCQYRVELKDENSDI